MKLKEFFQKKAWKKWDKSQWSILILTGVLLMVITVPTEAKKEKEEVAKQDAVENLSNTETKEDYRQELEIRLKDALSKIDGAGKVEVMITLEDSGESIVEKDTVSESSDLRESDQAGGNRAERNTQTAYTSVYKEDDSEKTPFVGKEMAPKVAGVLIVAQGGENTTVKQNISEAVMALFQIEVNRIKVVKMNIQEEGY